MNKFLLSLIPSKIRTKFLSSDARTREAAVNSLISLVVKGVTVLCSLIIIPLTINYVNPTRYGIWLTLSGIIGWVHFFDLGLGNGFRNKFAEAKANGNHTLAKEYVSTTYATITCIVVTVFSLSLIGNCFIDWSSWLKVDATYREELSRVFVIVLVFVCSNMVFNLFSTLLTADQKNGYASLIGGIGQILSVLCIWILTKYTSSSLFNLALYYSGIPTIVMLLVSLYMFSFSKYKLYRPSFGTIRPSLIKNILSLGVSFFIIYLCLIAVFQLVNFALSRELGPQAVTQYNIAYKYFNVLYMSITILVTPYWSAFTDAYTLKDYTWMRSTTKMLDKCLLLSVGICMIMLLAASWFYKIWIGNSVAIPYSLSIAMMVMTIASCYGLVYMYLINGIGTVRIQLITYVIAAIISWPGLIVSCRTFGLAGIVIMPTICYIAQALLGKIQLNKIMNQTATGLWIK